MNAAVRKKEKRVQTPESRVGLKMKHMRLLKGLTLKKLAGLAHCSEIDAVARRKRQRQSFD